MMNSGYGRFNPSFRFVLAGINCIQKKLAVLFGLLFTNQLICRNSLRLFGLQMAISAKVLSWKMTSKLARILLNWPARKRIKKAGAKISVLLEWFLIYFRSYRPLRSLCISSGQLSSLAKSSFPDAKSHFLNAGAIFIVRLAISAVSFLNILTCRIYRFF